MGKAAAQHLNFPVHKSAVILCISLFVMGWYFIIKLSCFLYVWSFYIWLTLWIAFSSISIKENLFFSMISGFKVYVKVVGEHIIMYILLLLDRMVGL